MIRGVFGGGDGECCGGYSAGGDGDGRGAGSDCRRTGSRHKTDGSRIAVGLKVKRNGGASARGDGRWIQTGHRVRRLQGESGGGGGRQEVAVSEIVRGDDIGASDESTVKTYLPVARGLAVEDSESADGLVANHKRHGSGRDIRAS